MPLLSSKLAAQNKTGLISQKPIQGRVNLNNLHSYIQLHTLAGTAKREVFELLYELLDELKIVELPTLFLSVGKIAEYAGFNEKGDFSDQAIDWDKLTYYIAFRAPFLNGRFEEYFEKWYNAINTIRLRIWQNNSEFPASTANIKRLCLNGENEIWEPGMPSVIDEKTPPPVKKEYTTRGDYKYFLELDSNDQNDNNLLFYSALKNDPEYYFGNVTIEDDTDDSQVPLEYYLISRIENPYNQGFWNGETSKGHIPTGPSGLTIGLGMDLGHCGISNASLLPPGTGYPPDEDPNNPGYPNPDFREFTLNYFLLNVSQQWRESSSEEKVNFYKITRLGYPDGGNYRESRPPVRKKKADPIKKTYAIFDLIDLAYSLQNTIGGYKNTIKATVPFWERYYYIGANNLTSIERSNGLPFPKVFRRLQNAGMKANPNVIEKFAVLAIGYNGPGSITSNSYRKFAEAINKHDFYTLYQAVLSCSDISSSKDKVLRYFRDVVIFDNNIELNPFKRYYMEIHHNDDIDI